MRRSAALAAVLATASFAVGGVDAAAEPQGRQAVYAAAAAEFGVPESVLLAVSYLESRWNTNSGTPSTAAGYGPMHLTDVVEANAGGSHHDEGTEDPRGDTARPALRPRPGAPDLSSPALRTVELASELTGVDSARLRSDVAQNIRGGAALLAHHQRALGVHGTDAGDWYGAVARYSGAGDTATAAAFADEVFATVAAGADRVTDDGQRVRLVPQAVTPDTAQLRRLGLRETERGEAECPRGLGCEWLPAPYEEFGEGDYGNHDKANRPHTQKIDYIVIHDTETTWQTTLDLVSDPTYVSWQYTLRSADGHVAQHVKAKDVAWQAGNWYINSKSIGLEHEGFAAQGTWYTEAMYRSSAKLVRYLAAKHHIPLDRAHIIGHDNVPGTIPSTVRGMHWDPGPYWDWAHYFELLGAPFRGVGTPRAGLVTIRPDFDTNRPAFTGCDAAGQPCPSRGSTSVILHTEPRPDAPLLTDIGLRPDGSPGTMHISDHSSRVETGQRYALAERRGDWTAIWYLGQKGWFHNPSRAPTAVWSFGLVATPKRGLASIPVYGRAYPEAAAYPEHVPVQAVTPLQYTLAAGQRYAVGLVTGSEYYWAVTYDTTNHTVVRGKTKYVQIQFGHRIAFVNAADVDLRPSALP
ncbi:peptidoglycan recognition protein family protein [Actinophytocola xanthii]|uniref:N-acetylmuramoyl-L-alanine amidase n=1 Tax=Actinophytocola xanthii TaxID=1912961 RepID=A0A1Q8CDR3_9PSEU|nr:N-acetylmuramoyl-L-alanine amidase [Actinophytocola xanthii]OLF12496.1 N-acetylmuramoyl-L-alanine amidase [Actinophytocola xanthii]